ncbi:hypothetical protein BCY84_06972 [Trypanosoma cruzi cruzi]|nr:hypothetical protein BCY84_06972 [Trypanosoma cruzi cruzi]
MRRLCAFRTGTPTVPHRRFGNAPNRVRPVETPCMHAWRQTEREVSVAVALAVMFVVPVWVILLSGSRAEQKRESVRRWAMGQQRGGEWGRRPHPRGGRACVCVCV